MTTQESNILRLTSVHIVVTVDTKCNAFTYNQLNDECLLKTAVNQWVQFYAWSITGVKLSQGLQNE
jgi:hypothetical protein